MPKKKPEHQAEGKVVAQIRKHPSLPDHNTNKSFVKSQISKKFPTVVPKSKVEHPVHHEEHHESDDNSIESMLSGDIGPHGKLAQSAIHRKYKTIKLKHKNHEQK